MTALALTHTAPLTLPRVTRRAVLKAFRAGLAPLKAEPPQRLADWAGENFYLSPEASHTRGEWAAWPFQIGILDWMGDDAIEELSVRKSKRTGYTKMLLAFMAYCAAHRRRKLALWQPTDDDRDSFVKSEIEPMLRDVRALGPVMPPRAAQDTIKLKTFLGSVWHLLGGKAARAYRRITVAVALIDELDGFDQMVEKSADPITLARGRLEGAPFPKLVAGSTPRLKGLSHIEHRSLQAQVRMRYLITCPHCDAEHPLMWGGKNVPHGFKWDTNRPETVRHVCPHCHGSITQADYLARWVGTWADQDEAYRYGADRIWRDATGQPCRAPRHVAAHIWAAYSPQRSWESIAREAIEAAAKFKAGDHGPMQGFVNETLGDVWELKGESADEHVLAKRAAADAQPYRCGTVPVGCLKLVAGLDVQDDRVEVVVWGFGLGEEMWCIDYQVLHFNLSVESEWAIVDRYLETRFTQAWHGGGMPIDACTIDSGGHFTHQVYYWARKRAHKATHAGKGSSKAGQPIKGAFTLQDIHWNGQKLKNGARLYAVGTDTAKDLIFGRLQVTQPGPGYVHFPTDLPHTFYKGITGEMRVLVKTPTGEEHRWIKTYARNEPLDCTVYALHAAHCIGVHLWTPAAWQRLLAAVQPPPDLFSPIAPALQGAAADAAREAAKAEDKPDPPRRHAVPPADAIAALRETAPRNQLPAGRQW